MMINPRAITSTTLFRLARAVLPEALLLPLFGRRLPASVAPTAADVRRMLARRRFDD